ncbi:hypothetical protein V2J09_002411 [Rumex salicifolius]
MDLCCTKLRRRSTPSVIVIGAGMAGLAAARALYDASIQFSRVTNVVRHHAGVKVTVEDGTVLASDTAIIAAFLGVLKVGIIKFEPRLPKWKEAAISELGVGIENKFVLHFDQVFWPNVEFLGVVAESSGGFSYFLNLHKATGHRVLVYMPAGKLAEHIGKMADEEAANFAFSQLKQVIPDANSPVKY